MTSKSLFFKLLKDDLKRRIWTIALATVVFFLSFPIACAILLGNYVEYTDREVVYNRLINFVEPNAWIIFVTVTGAVICGLSGFFYLHSKRKVDLYHSIPVRRELLFFVKYVNGLLIYLIPYAISSALSLIVIQVNGYMSSEILGIAISSLGINFVYYCLIYTVVILTDMLTGNFVVNGLGTAVFLLYGVSIVFIQELLLGSFFTTYYQNMTEEWKIRFLSPVGTYISVADDIYEKANFNIWNIISAIIITLVLIGIALFLYKKRPSEAAGKAMAFKISKPIIKFLLVIPIALGGGLLFRNTVDRGQDGWFIFGLLFCLLLSYALIEIIYNFDIRSAFLHKKELLACIGIVAVITCIFRFDLLHYDQYIPKENSIKSMAVAINGLEDDIRYYDNNGDYYNTREYQLKYMKLTDFDSAYELAKAGIESQDSIMAGEYIYFHVKYELKNGRSVYRSYKLAKGMKLDLISSIFELPEYKQAHYPITQLNPDEMNEIVCNNMLNNKSLTLNSDEKQELLSLYIEDLNKQSLAELTQSFPIATFEYRDKEHYRGINNIYPEFEKTIAFLKDHGFDPLDDVTESDIKNIYVNNMNVTYSEDYKENYRVSTQAIEESNNVTYSQQEEISEIFSKLIQQDHYWNNRSVINVEEAVEVNIQFGIDEFGNDIRISYYFRKGEIPDFVKEDINWMETTN